MESIFDEQTRTFATLHSIRPMRVCHQGFQVDVVGREKVLGTSPANRSLLVYEHHQFGECMQAVSSETSVQPRITA